MPDLPGFPAASPAFMRPVIRAVPYYRSAHFRTPGEIRTRIRCIKSALLGHSATGARRIFVTLHVLAFHSLALLTFRRSAVAVS
jgi:hypothetical protein